MKETPPILAMLVLFRRLFYLTVLGLFAASATAAPGAAHVFIISIDGGKPEVILRSEMPVLRQVVAEGAHTWAAQTILPPLTLPSHTSMLTGVTTNKHHITWNRFVPENGFVKVPTIFALAKPAGISTAMFVGKEKFRTLEQPGTLDIFSFKVAESALVTKVMAGDTKVRAEGTVLAKVVAPAAAAYIREKKPGLCFIHFTDTDDVGHAKGWGSTNQVQAFANVDAALGVVMTAIREAGIAGDSVVIITADHGGHGHTHGMPIPADLTIPWIAWGRGVKPGFEITAPVSTCDTAATALWLLGIAVPESFDGKPVRSAFE